MVIRTADIEGDYEGIWEIFSRVVKTGDTYVYEPHTPRELLREYWFAGNMDTFVAEDDKGVITGTYTIRPNHTGLGSHIANCSYMVHPEHQGKGIGSLLCAHSLRYAAGKGYLGMQFNIVVSTNAAAIRLWKKYGFEIIGTTPRGFRHKNLGLVDTYIMYKDLQAE